MTKKEYATKVAEIVGGKVTAVEKANGVVLTGVVCGEENKNIRPTIYIDQMYEDGISVEKSAETVKEMVERSMIPMPDLSRIYDFEKIKGDIRLRLYNKATHADIYKSASEYGFDDLIIVPYLDNVIPNGSIKITASLMEIWGVNEDTIFDVASNAGDYEIFPLHFVLEDIARKAGREFPTDIDCPMFIVTNKSRCYGAYGVIALRERIREIFVSGWTVIPSSIHECIVIPSDSADYQIVNDMVKQVNAECVCPEEVLGNRAYEF